MAATLTTTPPLEENAFGRPIRKYTLDWVSHTDGSVALTTGHLLNGEVVNIVFIPSGTAQPTNAYDVTITDGSGLDVASGFGANLSNTATTRCSPFVSQVVGAVTYNRPWVVAEEVLTLNITAAGNAKAGQILIYLR